MKKVGRRDKELINILRQEVPLKLIILLMCEGPGDIYKSHKDFWGAMKDPTAHTKLKSVKDLEELTKYWQWEKDLLRVKKARSTIDFHLNKLLKADLIERVRVGKEIKYQLKDYISIYTFFIENNKVLSNEIIDFLMTSSNDGQSFKYGFRDFENKLWEIFPHPYHA